MLKCDLHLYSFRLLRDWITEREREGPNAYAIPLFLGEWGAESYAAAVSLLFSEGTHR
jgi:hypothetical protein